MRKPDWIVHAIIPEKNDMPFVRNFHTHGLSKFKHPELMLVLNIPEDIATEILNGLGEKIKKKEQRFEEEGRYLNILANGYPVKLVKQRMGEEDVMIILLPDEKKRLPGEEGCKYPYSAQLQMIKWLQNTYNTNSKIN